MDTLDINEKRILTSLDDNELIDVLHRLFPEILLMNLSHNTYHIITRDKGVINVAEDSGKVDDLTRLRADTIYKEDREEFVNTFSYEALYKTFAEQKKESIKLVYRRHASDNTLQWFETRGYLHESPSTDDILVVFLTLNIDERKTKELATERELYLQAEEIRTTMNKIDKQIMFYDIPTKTLSVSTDYSQSKHIPKEINNFPDCITDLNDEVFSEKNLKIINSFYASICRGEASGFCELEFGEGKDSRWERMEFVTISDKSGKPVRAVILSENITENQRLKATERLFKAIAEHTELTISIYDIKDSSTIVMDPSLDRGFTHNHKPMVMSKMLIEDSRRAVQNMFNNIYSGSRNGTVQVCALGDDNKKRWYEIKYTTMFDENDSPSSVLFTHKDITRMYERDLAYERQRTKEGAKVNYILYLEADLSADHIDTISGSVMSGYPHHNMVKYTDFVNVVLGNNMFTDGEDITEDLFSRSSLINKYLLDTSTINKELRINTNDDSEVWVKFEIILLEDPYSKHIKVFIQAYDISGEKAEANEIKQKAEYDGLTGILNRITSENLITDSVLNAKGDYGILIIADLDNLKGINDTYGHEQGDRAIKNIAATMKHHFRQDDIIGRLGGDEFIIYLSGAAENKDSIAISLSNLLRKIASISIGPNNEQRIHCSMGCVVQQEGDTFASLYRDADTALYHVKRNGKNNYAFFTPEMRKEDYQFKREKFFHKDTAKKLSSEEISHLITALSSFCPGIMSVNLSKNNYLLMENENSTFVRMPNYGSLEDFFAVIRPLIHKDDQHIIDEDFSIANLLSLYESGETSVVRHIRSMAHGTAKSLEISIVFYVNSDGDVCDFTFIRWI